MHFVNRLWTVPAMVGWVPAVSGWSPNKDTKGQCQLYPGPFTENLRCFRLKPFSFPGLCLQNVLTGDGRSSTWSLHGQSLPSFNAQLNSTLAEKSSRIPRWSSVSPLGPHNPRPRKILYLTQRLTWGSTPTPCLLNITLERKQGEKRENGGMGERQERRNLIPYCLIF